MAELSRPRILFFLCIAAMTLAVLVIQNSSEFFASYVGEDIRVKRVDATNWTVEIASLRPGPYFVSVGRPRAACSLYLDGAIIDSNMSVIPEVRSKMLLGGSFLSTGTNQKLDIRCSEQRGLKPGLAHKPIVARHHLGLALHLWRALTELLLGPTTSLLLLLTTLARGFSSSKKRNLILSPQFLFAAAALLYSISLGHFSRLFLPGVAASLLHIVLRTCFSFAFVVLCASYTKGRWIVYVGHIGLLVIFCSCWFSPELIEPIYNNLYIAFPVLTLITAFDVLKVEESNASIRLLKLLLSVWALVQISDTFNVWLNVGAYVAPSVVALMTATVTYMGYRERLRDARIETATARILSVVGANSSVRDAVIQVSSVLHGETHFSRASAYVDAFCIGRAESPRSQLLRIMETGYQKSTEQDLIINFADGRGAEMWATMEVGEVKLLRGKKDGAWFILVPVGRHACINLSNAERAKTYLVYESFEIVQRVFPALKALENKLVDYSLHQGSALERMRSLRGDGRWETKLGAIFADISDYSIYTERFGTSFPDFIATTYFPALIRHIGKWAVTEFVRGDEIYLVCLPGLVQENVEVHKATYHALTALLGFVRNEGRGLCEQNGFPPVTMAVGVNIGMGSIICDPIKVRTTGQSVNEAKRLQEAAGKGGVLIHSVAVDALNEFSMVLSEEAPILVKKNMIMARRLLHLNEKSAA